MSGLLQAIFLFPEDAMASNARLIATCVIMADMGNRLIINKNSKLSTSLLESFDLGGLAMMMG